jgi:hypothetical protein
LDRKAYKDLKGKLGQLVRKALLALKVKQALLVLKVK